MYRERRFCVINAQNKLNYEKYYSTNLISNDRNT
jgi:hypothetical protein